MEDTIEPLSSSSGINVKDLISAESKEKVAAEGQEQSCGQVWLPDHEENAWGARDPLFGKKFLDLEAALDRLKATIWSESLWENR